VPDENIHEFCPILFKEYFMTIIFTIRLDEELNDTLFRLAYLTHRSKAGVVRWLITKASNDLLNYEAIHDSLAQQISSETDPSSTPNEPK
jgi:predicted transcriptional regulator